MQWRAGADLVYKILKLKWQWRFVLGNHILPTLGFGLIDFHDNMLGCDVKLGFWRLNVTRRLIPN